MDDGHMHDYKEKYNIAIILWKPPCIIITSIRPLPLGQYFHHHILRMDETVEVSELYLIIVWCIVLNIIKLGTIEYLHPNNAKDIEEKSKNIEEFNDNWHDFYKSRKQSLDFLDNLESFSSDIFAREDHLNQTYYPQKTKYFHKFIELWTSLYKEKDDT